MPLDVRECGLIISHFTKVPFRLSDSKGLFNVPIGRYTPHHQALAHAAFADLGGDGIRAESGADFECHGLLGLLAGHSHETAHEAGSIRRSAPSSSSVSK